MIRALISIAAFLVVAGPALSALADCAGHSTTVQSENTTTTQTVVQGESTPTTPIPPATPKTGG
jgi:hypothetical protein